MKPTHYFCYCGHETMAKNKLQKDFGDYLRGLQGVIVDAENVKLLKETILRKAEDLNKLYHRCQPLKVSFSDLFGKKGFRISGFYCIDFFVLEGYCNNNF